MKYLVIGAGGTGGLIGGYLGKKGYDVTLIARGEHLLAMQKNGLTIKTYGKAPVTIKQIKAVSEEAIENEEFDVVFVCVKAYHLKDIIQLLKKACYERTLIIPILNSLQAGNYLRAALPDHQVYDGCIYVTGYVSAPGEVSQNTSIFKILYGLNEESHQNRILRERMEFDVKNSGIEIQYSSVITNEIFRKLTFTSAFASCAAYYDKQASDVQVNGLYRTLFIHLLYELEAISGQANLGLAASFINDNLAILDSLSADFTASIQKDLKQGKADEREQLIFDVVRIAEKHQVQVPFYSKIASHFGYRSEDILTS
jgi:2-dehydropantoate 2-reductase